MPFTIVAAARSGLDDKGGGYLKEASSISGLFFSPQKGSKGADMAEEGRKNDVGLRGGDQFPSPCSSELRRERQRNLFLPFDASHREKRTKIWLGSREGDIGK